ncbi:hypothetical protein C5Y41_24550 [Rahnella variigena]|uniref:DUF6708 domain-containing protein n=1 Tax=Rahnella variigena TaxID=574964 RepID=UPI00101C0E1A|nr:hypothetical protein C5Y41_24550 [Rahnella variigena]
MMGRRTSRLIKPVRGWSEDLPDPEEEQRVYPRLIRVNEINDVWMEIPRYVNYGWGGQWFAVILLLCCSPLCLWFLLLPGFFHNVPTSLIFMIITACFFLVSFVLIHLRSVLFEPRGAPVRFNRKQQKVYVYEYKKSIWPWARWPVTIKVFDWADIQGERVEMSGHADWGHRVYCAVCRPGTYQVADRFVLTWTVGSIHDVYGLWSACCQYMQGKAVSDKPLRTDTPPDWTPFRTVRWPEEMDKASRVVPEWS